MLPAATDGYSGLCRDFSWDIPEFYNIGVDACDKWADDPARLALIHRRADGTRRDYTFAQMRRLSNRFANVLARHGVRRGDRVAILLPQCPETAISHIATYKLGAIAVPLFTLFGVDALEYRLGNCAARALVTDQAGARKIAEIRDLLPALEHVYVIDGKPDDCLDFKALGYEASDDFTPVATRADDPALIIYTSGTTGQPKGALHAHRVLLGHLPGVEMSHDLFPQPGDLMWTPADWAWIGGLLDVLLPAWHHGVAVVAHRFEKFSAERACELIAEYGVRNAFLPPTALKMMRATPPEQLGAHRCALRTIASGGETLGAEMLHWGRETFGLTINEFYGQTECNMIVSSAHSINVTQAGSMGCAVPGHDVGIIDETGVEMAPGRVGMIAVRSPDPVMFLHYWRNEDATKAKYIGDWLVTGDLGMKGEDGFIRFVGREDDVISSAGYRIGPGEIEDCLIAHPAVRMAGVIGKEDPLRGQIIKAFLVLDDPVRDPESLTRDLSDFVRTRLGAHEYPREFAFVDTLPMTATGKIVRRALRDMA
ncbi:AMP-dependent synthetase [Thalassospira profundimaris]|uniref:AMP-dependent synthetase n=1 Tax=Thalassospira profundimaris TaxID=502049 RepID=A0A367XKJ7_9PROT|nr:acyl-CoA synthetase [Thalassospira profundimaris]RCK54184.1 AMP-dependent synthetase [Thalassospira profundimaris]